MSVTNVTGTTSSAHEVLARSRSLVDPALRAAIDTLPTDLRHIAGYHFAWWDEHGQPTPAADGKALRPALVLLSAEAVGGSAAAAVPAAAAVELVHNFSLLHDDVMDNDTTRRHRPTAWSVFGVNAAILAGDALLSLASGVLADSGHPAALAGVRRLNTAVQELTQGQVMDIAFEQRTDVDVVECQRMAQAKTGALLGCACSLGAAYGHGTERQVDALHAFGHHLGLAFQHTDDLLGIWGEPHITGKPAYSDLQGRKKTLPVVAALTADTPSARELAARYDREATLTDAELAETADLVEAAGGRVWSTSQADQLLTRAHQHLRAADPVARIAELDALAHLATSRTH